MKVVILAGGFGSRLSEYTDKIPKPMVTVGNRPILWHIMNHYSRFGYNDFYIALGYKAEEIKNYFLNYSIINSDFTVNLENGGITTHDTSSLKWNVTLVDTGLHSMTGGRVRRMKKYIGDKPFLLTYGDGLSNININKLVEFHQSHGKLVTVSAVRPAARFGELEITNNAVTKFQEKRQINQGWINGGFFVAEPEIFDMISDDATILEREPLERLAEMGELMPFLHGGFWQCMDTKRDRDLLEALWERGDPPWTLG